MKEVCSDFRVRCVVVDLPAPYADSVAEGNEVAPCLPHPFRVEMEPPVQSIVRVTVLDPKGADIGDVDVRVGVRGELDVNERGRRWRSRVHLGLGDSACGASQDQYDEQGGGSHSGTAAPRPETVLTGWYGPGHKLTHRALPFSRASRSGRSVAAVGSWAWGRRSPQPGRIDGSPRSGYGGRDAARPGVSPQAPAPG